MGENEAKECEVALLNEIRILEEAIVTTPNTTTSNANDPNKEQQSQKQKQSGNSSDILKTSSSSEANSNATDPLQIINHFTSVDAILTSELTPPDRFFSVSALL